MSLCLHSAWIFLYVQRAFWSLLIFKDYVSPNLSRRDLQQLSRGDTRELSIPEEIGFRLRASITGNLH